MFSFNHSVFALGEKITEVAGGIGETVTETASDIGNTVGIRLTAKEIDTSVNNALKHLYATTPEASYQRFGLCFYL